MILVDTSVWIEHFRKGHEALAQALYAGQVLTHDFVIEELACGSLSKREEILQLLSALPKAPQIVHKEALEFIQRHKLWGMGLSSIDIHLLCSALLINSELWTLDKALLKAYSLKK